ncbi:MAG: hypothetical protein FWD62_14120 [Betaproteobacteria bacterium]|nr:hypothetical protein [Betaproteobacteria bacterium]
MHDFFRRNLPWLLLILVLLGLVLAGPLHLPPGYHDFADHRNLFGIANAIDVLSNLGFLFAGLWGLWVVSHLPKTPARFWWYAFALAVAWVCFGSGWYHLAPDDARLVWDRVPIELVCATLLTAVISEHYQLSVGQSAVLGVLLSVAALVAVFGIPWFAGDLRPYLSLQIAVLILVPALSWGDRVRRFWFTSASLLYVLAKLAEVADAQILALTGGLSGHSLKHLLAAAASAAVIFALSQRQPEKL